MARARGKAKGGRAGRGAGGAGRGPGGVGRDSLTFKRALPVLTATAAFLVAVAIFPFDVPGLPAGKNPLGDAGQVVENRLLAALGAGSAAVPLCLLALAATLGKWWSPEVRKRGWILSAGLAALLPVTAYLLGRPLAAETGCPPDAVTVWTGRLGVQAIGGPLCGVVGWLGTALLAGAGWIGVSVAVFGVNPLTLVGSGVARASRGAGRAARRAADVAGEAAARLRERRNQLRERKQAEEAQRQAEAQEAAAQAEQARRAEQAEQAPQGHQAEQVPLAQPGGQAHGAERAAALPREEAPAEQAAPQEPRAAVPEGLPWEAEAPLEVPEGQYLPPTGELPSGEPPAEPPMEPSAERPAPGAAVSPASVAGPTSAPGPAAGPASAHGSAPAHQAEGDAAGPADGSAAAQPWPSLELLAEPEHRDRLGMERELDRLGEVLVKTLDTFNIRSSIGGRTTGPAVTQFEVVPAAGVKVNRIANLDADLALAMKARSVRIVAPIPGKGAVGVEIPNPEPEMVRLREILGDAAFARSGAALPLGLGKDLTGQPYVTDLTKMPHALIAGATGSGKSVCLNTIITSLVYKNGPDRLRLLLIDPKMVELSAYSDLPHLRHPVVTDPKDAAGVLKWAVLEMERRYALLSANGVRSLMEFNARVENEVPLRRPDPDGPEGDEDRWVYKDGPLPYVVVVVDELADLMMQVQADVEKPLAQLAQKARAIGIHLLVATQRPTVNVVTGLIKANFPCRIAFRVASKTDSRTILDQNGADSLLGHGDMLFLPPGQSGLVRMQGAFISTEETEALMGWYREQAGTLEAIKARVTRSEEDILETLRAVEGADDDEDGGAIVGDWDDLFREAAEACIQQGGGSTSLLQRRLRIGYGRAARIVDQLHDAGVLGPPDGSKPREVLVGPEGLDEICPS